MSKTQFRFRMILSGALLLLACASPDADGRNQPRRAPRADRSARTREQQANEEREKKFIAERNKQTELVTDGPFDAREPSGSGRSPAGGVRREREEAHRDADAGRAEGRQPRRDVRRRAPGRERLLVGGPQLDHQRAVPRSRGFRREARGRQGAAVHVGPRTILVRAAAGNDRERAHRTLQVQGGDADGKPLETTVVRVGPFNASVQAEYLQYLPAQKQLADHAAPADERVPVGGQAAGRLE